MSDINAVYDLNNASLFTYGMIGIATLALAGFTMMDDDNKSFAKDNDYEKIVNESKKDEVNEEKKEETPNEEKNYSKYKHRKTRHNKKQNTYTRKQIYQ
jgi:hypothetical protein